MTDWIRCPECGGGHRCEVDDLGATQASAAAAGARRAEVAPAEGPDALGPAPAEARYRVGGLLGRGGMGVVWQADDVELGRPVVIKQLHADLAANALQVRRFVDEARITALLEHPNIVPVHDLGRAPDGQPYFSMKRVGGVTLMRVLAALAAGEPQARLDYPLTQRVQLFGAICNAVGFAHSRGVIHRDLKPENVMLGEFGQVLVMDWGLAKRLTDPADPVRDVGSTDDSGTRTQAGAILGTPHYMAPEQARGEVAAMGPHSDVYALGVILFELLWLRTPTGGDAMHEVLFRVAQGLTVPPGSVAGDPVVPPELASIVDKAMAFDPADRYASVPLMTADLQAWLNGVSVPTFGDSASRRLLKWARRNRAATAGLAAAVVALVLGLGAMTTIQGATLRRQLRRSLDQATTELESAAADRSDTGMARLEQARDRCVRVLGRAPDDPRARQLLDRVHRRIAWLEQDARQRRRAGRLQARLTASEAGPATPAAEGRRVWFAAQFARLGMARELGRLPGGRLASRRALRAVCQRLAAQLTEEGSSSLAHLMVDDAERAGLPAERAKLARHAIDARQFAGVRRAREALVRLEGERVGQAYPEVLRQLLVDRSPELARLLIVTTCSRHPWQRRVAVEALGWLGDTRTRARVPTVLLPPRSKTWHLKDPSGAPRAWFKLSVADRRGRVGQRESMLDAVEMLILHAHALAPAAGEVQPLRDQVALFNALGRLGDARAHRVFNAWRSRLAPDSWAWRATQVAFGRLPWPDALVAPETADAWWERALAHDGRAEIAAALRCYDRAISGFPDEPSLTVRRGTARLRGGDLDGAEADLKAALARTPGALMLHLRLGQLALARGDVRAAAAWFDRHPYAEAPPSTADARGFARLALARARLLAVRQPAAALQRVQRALEAQRMLADAHALRATLLVALGRQGAALAAALEAVSLDPGLTDAWLTLAPLLGAQTAWGAALEAAASARQRDPGPRATRTLAALLRQRAGQPGPGALRATSSRRAVRLLRELAGDGPPPPALALAIVGAMAGHPKPQAQEMLAWLDRALTDAPDHVGLRRVKAGLILERLGDPDGALALLAPLLERDPGDAELYLMKARALFLKDRREAARTALAAGIQRGLRHPQADELLGDLRLLDDDRAGAIAAYRRAHRGWSSAREDVHGRRHRSQARGALAAALLARATERRAAGQTLEALADLDEICRIVPTHWQAQLTRAPLHVQRGQRGPARRALESARRHAPVTLHAQIDAQLKALRGR